MSAAATTSAWFKSSFSKEAANCVEVRFARGAVFMRDSKYLRDASNDPAAQPVIEVDVEQWPAFLDVATGSVRTAVAGIPDIEMREGGGVVLWAGDGTTLTYTAEEWDAFTAGVRAAEFAA